MKGFTHSGVFHADDVFATALLKLVYPEIEIVRGTVVPEGFEGIVYDIGMGEFDHHQADVRRRADGTAYAAFGLLWRVYGLGLVGEQEAEVFDRRFVCPLDAADNGEGENPLSLAVSQFNPAWNSGRNPDTCFGEAVEFAQGILRRYLEQVDARREARRVVEAALAESRGTVVVLPQYAPWQEVLVGSGKLFCVYPSNRGGWNAQVVPLHHDSREPAVYFPAEWVNGVPERLLQQGVKLNFCHRGRHLLNAEDRRSAVILCREAENAR